MGVEWILDRQHRAAEKETTEEARKKAHRRYQDEVLALSKAFALAAASDDARQIRVEICSAISARAGQMRLRLLALVWKVYGRHGLEGY